MGQQFTITLSDELADRMRAKVATGEYASAEEAIEAVLALTIEVDEGEAMIPDEEVETWLRKEVVPSLRAYESDRSNVLTMDEVEAGLNKTFEAISRRASR